MTKDWKYIVYITVLIVSISLIFLLKPKEYNWSVTYSHNGKEPFGTYALNALLPSHLKNKKVTNSYKTIYELKDSIQKKENIFIVCSQFSPDQQDAKTLLTLVENGATAFISANYFYGTFADTLGLYTGDSFFQGNNPFLGNDSTKLHFVSPALDSARWFQFRKGNVYNYFKKIDSVAATVLTKNYFKQPTSVLIKKGKGTLVLNCTPIVFTNIYLLAEDNHDFVAASLSYLPPENTIRTEFYHLGRMEVATPLRFILTTEPLKWAYYISIITLLLFMIFEAKRKQRIIPIIKPLANTTIEFISTIGNLYYQSGDHKNIAEKKIQFFFDYLHTHFRMNTSMRNEDFIMALSKKSGLEQSAINQLIQLINSIYARTQITKEELTTLNILLEKFYNRNKL
jgi:hypothetical protein